MIDNKHDPATCTCTTCTALRGASAPGYWDDHIAWERAHPPAVTSKETRSDHHQPRRRAPGGGRKPIGATAGEAAVKVRLDAATRAYWQGGGKRGELSNAVRSLLTDVADGDAVVLDVDTAEHLAVVPWLAARLAEVEAQDRDDTDLEDWLRALLDALADASQRRHRPRQ